MDTMIDSNRILIRIVGFQTDALEPTTRLVNFKLIVLDKDPTKKIIEMGGRFANVADSRENEGKTSGYTVYGFRGIALVVTHKTTSEESEYVIFAIDEVRSLSMCRGKGITSSKYVIKVREEIAKMARGESAKFPDVPLRYEINESGLRRSNAGSMDLRGFPKRVLGAAEKLARRYA
ncbi:MAG: hypothetical protein Q7S22_08315 [Candidatus Micrarchaeota archaeon]|nr:hypothetical protein [Candidatus Micrarchaeota archaeon]